jgi:hypothetical protein
MTANLHNLTDTTAADQWYEKRRSGSGEHFLSSVDAWHLFHDSHMPWFVVLTHGASWC